MTYFESLGLHEPPFGATASAGFFYGAGSRQQAVDALTTALSSGEAVLKLTGEAGTGKTTLCRALVDRLDPKSWVSLYFVTAEPDPRALTLAIARGLGAKVDDSESLSGCQRALGLHLLDLMRAGRRALVVIDECQGMPLEALEQVRRLTNLETSKRKLLQVLLCGQPALEAGLASPRVGDLRQRIGFEHTLGPLSKAEVAEYFDHRMRVAGYAGKPLLSRGAAKALFRLSGALPRLINGIAHKALQLMQAHGDRRLDADHVRRAAAETPALPADKRPAEGRHEWFWRSVAALLLVGVLWTAWVAYQLSPRELVTPQAFATPVEGRLARRAPSAGVAVSGAGRDPAILRSLGLPAARIATYSPTENALADEAFRRALGPARSATQERTSP